MEISLVTKVLHSLPNSYWRVISAWDLMPQNEQTMKNLHQRLLKEEVLNDSMSKLKLDDNDSVALYSKHGKNAKRHKITFDDKQKHIQTKFNGQCHYCCKKRFECWKHREENKQKYANLTGIGSSGEKPTMFTAEVNSYSVN